MSELKSWNDFLEPMEHEIKGCSIVLGVDACRVDNDGIKDHCKICNPANNNRVKSCDYFYILDEKFLCIEFSDLISQKSKRDDSINKIKKIGIDSSEWKRILEHSSSEVIISDEMYQKIIDTNFILEFLYSADGNKYICDLPSPNYSKHFFIVYHSPSKFDEVDNVRISDIKNDNFKSEIQRLQSKLATLPLTQLNYKEVYWLEINIFQEKYCNQGA